MQLLERVQMAHRAHVLAETLSYGEQRRVEIARATTDLLVQQLRERTLDALVVDARSLRPAPDLDAPFLHEMSGAFMVRRGHPLARRRAPACHPRG